MIIIIKLRLIKTYFAWSNTLFDVGCLQYIIHIIGACDRFTQFTYSTKTILINKLHKGVISLDLECSAYNQKDVRGSVTV